MITQPFGKRCTLDFENAEVRAPYVGENAVVCGPSYPLYKNQILLNFENPKAHVSSVSDNLIRTSAISDPGQFGTYATHQLDSDSVHQLPCIPTAANLVSDIATGMSHIVTVLTVEDSIEPFPCWVSRLMVVSTVPKVASDIGLTLFTKMDTLVELLNVDRFELHCLDGIRDASQDPSPSIVSIKRPPKGDNIKFKKRKKHLSGVTRFADPLLDPNATSICSNVEDMDSQYSKHSDEERISSELSNRNIHQSFVISPITDKSLCDTEVMSHAVWERQCELYFRQIGSVASAENGRPGKIVNRSALHRRTACRQSTHDVPVNTDELDCSYSNQNATQGLSSMYIDIGDCDRSCQYCGAMFWYGEWLKGYSDIRAQRYHKYCRGGKIVMRRERDPPNYIKHMLKDRHFLDNIRAYNHMFAITSFGAHIDESVNNRRGPYIFKVSGQIYHWIGAMCPPSSDAPLFLQLYIYDTQNEVTNRMRHFGGEANNDLDSKIIQALIHFLDQHNDLVQIFRVARDKCDGQSIL
ncbi:hypothetical protein Tco_0506806 [Tanacetum coccineum]